MIDPRLRPLVIQSFNQYPLRPSVHVTVENEENRLRETQFYFYSNGFRDGITYQEGLFKRVNKSEYRSIEALQTSLSTKDVRLMLQEQDLKRLRRLIDERNKALSRLQDLVKSINGVENPEKISMKYAQEISQAFTDDFFKRFSREIL